MSYNKETGMYEGYIYKIYNDVNDKIYIGQTIQTIEERLRKHTSDAFTRDTGMAIHAAIRKYGKENFHISEIECIKHKSKKELVSLLNKREIDNISLYNTISPNGYNISAGGVLNDTKKIPVIRYDTTIEKYFNYESITAASVDTGLDISRIYACCSGKCLSSNGNIFRYASDGISEDDINKYIQLHPKIKKFDYDGTLINIYLSATLAVEDVRKEFPKASTSGITACCKDKQKTAYGYVWRYEYDDFDVDDKYYIELVLSKNKEYIPKKDNIFIEKHDKYTGELIETYDGFKDIVNKLGFDRTNISYIRDCCNKKIASTLGCHWCYKGEFNPEDLNRVLESPVDMYSLEGEYLNGFDSIRKGLEFIGRDKNLASVIINCCIGNTETAYGFVWRYRGEPFGKVVKKDRNNTPVDIYKYTTDGVFIERYTETKEIAAIYNLTLSQVRNLINKHKCINSEYVLFYADEEFDTSLITYYKEQRVNQYDLNDNYIGTHLTANHAGRDTGSDSSRILKCCKKKAKSTNGCKWFYADDESQPDKSKILKQDTSSVFF